MRFWILIICLLILELISIRGVTCWSLLGVIGVCFTYQKEDKTWATKAQPTACEEADEFRLRKQIHTEAQ